MLTAETPRTPEFAQRKSQIRTLTYQQKLFDKEEANEILMIMRPIFFNPWAVVRSADFRRGCQCLDRLGIWWLVFMKRAEYLGADHRAWRL
jgi:hypothetical protein